MNRRSFLKAVPVLAVGIPAVANSMVEDDGYEQHLDTIEGIYRHAEPDVLLEYDEYQRLWREKLMEHKKDLEHALLFGIRATETPTPFGAIRMIDQYIAI